MFTGSAACGQAGFFKKKETKKGSVEDTPVGGDKVGIPVPKAKGYGEEKGRLQPDKGMSGLSAHMMARTEQSVLRNCWERGHGSMGHGRTLTSV